MRGLIADAVATFFLDLVFLRFAVATLVFSLEERFKTSCSLCRRSVGPFYQLTKVLLVIFLYSFCTFVAKTNRKICVTAARFCSESTASVHALRTLESGCERDDFAIAIESFDELFDIF
jgi:hypothetical protein